MSKAFCSVLILVFLCTLLPNIGAVRPRYQHFEDYLNSLDRRDQSWLSEPTPKPTVDDEDDDEVDNVFEDNSAGTPSTTTSTEPTTTTAGPLLTLQQTREVSCCLLGQVAGDKGYHCYVQYYAARIILRNRNRAHNRKMNFYGPERIKDYGEKVMKTFGQCVNGMGHIFHKCCHLAALERRPQRYNSEVRTRYLRGNHRGHTTEQPQLQDGENS